MAAALTSNEEAQLLQTIEMFEVITQSQPMDCQSLEILKEAYSKLGREAELVQTSKRIAEANVNLGQLSSAILEYESILQRNPDDPDVQKALAEIESKANSFAAPTSPAPETVASEKRGGLASRKRANEPAEAPLVTPAEVDDGRQQMHKLLVEGKHVASLDFDQLWPKINPAGNLRQPPDPFLNILHDRKLLAIEKSLRLVCDKARIAYLPIDRYDVDVDFARTFSRDSCVRWCMLPFDRMSKSILIATANPFNKQAALEVERHSKARVIWYAANPADLVKVIKRIYR